MKKTSAADYLIDVVFILTEILSHDWKSSLTLLDFYLIQKLTGQK